MKTKIYRLGRAEFLVYRRSRGTKAATAAASSGSASLRIIRQARWAKAIRPQPR